MRLIRLIFITLVALILVGLALANRQMVTISAFPANFGQYLDGDWNIAVPLFLVIFVSFGLGMVFGLVGEWLREAHIRRNAREQAEKAARLQNEVGNLRQEHSAPRDEVLAIVDNPKKGPRTPAPRAIASPEPAPGTTLPSTR
ncbi:LapA family protein [Paracoccus fistulariae]|uniref:LapA family protein n=1 Tax=Paracoccus fistulariae TaxID=658446 RepID=A0ABY7SPI5_9RHOB|nr:LapA family protein [Paracoccus fistulariae]MDB6179852.1 LapA family protein [Paracoccus fistulariae]WCR07956.1 LapA family protein [Paracoccus fistulariae]